MDCCALLAMTEMWCIEMMSLGILEVALSAERGFGHVGNTMLLVAACAYLAWAGGCFDRYLYLKHGGGMKCRAALAMTTRYWGLL